MIFPSLWYAQRLAHYGTTPLAHLVLAVAVCDSALILRLQLVINRNIQVSSVLVVRSASQLALDVLAGLDGQDVCEVEDCLLPVGVFCVGSGAESHGLVAGRELDVEPGNQGVDVVCSANGQAVG